MTIERFVVRAFLTLVVVAISTAFFPFMLLMKLAEGVWLGFSLTAASVRQVWSARGIPELDNPAGRWDPAGARVAKRPED